MPRHIVPLSRVLVRQVLLTRSFPLIWLVHLVLHLGLGLGLSLRFALGLDRDLGLGLDLGHSLACLFLCLIKLNLLSCLG